MTEILQAVREEFLSAVAHSTDGPRTVLAQSLAEHTREWVAANMSRGELLKFVTSKGAYPTWMDAVEAALDSSNEGLWLLLVGGPGHTTAAICSRRVTGDVLRQMLQRGRFITACALSSSGGLTFDVDLETGGEPAFYMEAWGTLKAPLARAAEAFPNLF